MAYNFLIAPDFSPERFAGWHMFNTLLQKRSGHDLHLVTPASHAEQEDSLPTLLMLPNSSVKMAIVPSLAPLANLMK